MKPAYGDGLERFVCGEGDAGHVMAAMDGVSIEEGR